MKRLKEKMQEIEKAMTAASLAEEGAFDAARELLKEERRVLLAIRDGRVDVKTEKYALNTCKRINARLDILSVSSTGSAASAENLLRNFQSRLEEAGILNTVIRRSGCLKEEIISYTKAESSVLFAVIESSGDLDIDCRGSEKKLSGIWQKLSCPLVVVSEAGA